MRPLPGRILALLLLVSSAAALSAHAQPPPLASGLFAFPASNPSPASAVSAALGLADRWLGEEPFDNPALGARRVGAVSGLLHRLSRQDLRAHNRQYDEQLFFIDPVGLWGAMPLGVVRAALYAGTPVLRREDNSFLRGDDPTAASAVVKSVTETREIRAGLAIAAGQGPVVFGAAAEYTYRDDRYSASEESGAPESGTHEIDFNGGGFGGQAGVRIALPRSALGELSVGGSLRYLPSLSLDGTWSADLTFLADSTAPIAVEREAGWEGGISIADRVGPTVRILAGGGVRTARTWDALQVTGGTAWSAALALEYHDEQDPWTARFGFGREGESGSPTPQSTVVGLGLGWRFDRMVLDFGALRRSLAGGNAPTSFDDRLVVTVTQEF